MLTHTPQSIATYSGKFIEPLNPKYDDIELVDIAHGLSNICRYGGQCRDFYSVAQHSVYVSYNVPKEDALNGLLHDSSEAYLGDIPRPIKHTPQYKFYREVEEYLQTMIFQKFGYTKEDEFDLVYENDAIKTADNQILSIEQQHLFDKPWTPKLSWSTYKDDKGKCLLDTFIPWLPTYARGKFLDRFSELVGENENNKQ